MTRGREAGGGRRASGGLSRLRRGCAVYLNKTGHFSAGSGIVSTVNSGSLLRHRVILL